ncbi:hypothetical protein Tco_1386547 [Tanacetum coccineum]
MSISSIAIHQFAAWSSSSELWAIRCLLSKECNYDSLVRNQLGSSWHLARDCLSISFGICDGSAVLIFFCIFFDASFPPNLAIFGFSLKILHLQIMETEKMSIGMEKQYIRLSHCFFLRLQQVKFLVQILREMQDQLCLVSICDYVPLTDGVGRDRIDILYEVIMNGDAPAIASARMQKPYGKQSRLGLEATKNQRKYRKPFRSSNMRILLPQGSGRDWIIYDRLNVTTTIREVTLLENAEAPRNQGNRNGDAPRRIVPVETPANALVVQDGIGGYDWSFQAEEGNTNFALMPYTSQSSSSSSSYQMGLESLEARIVVHEKNEAVYEEDIAFLKYDVQVKDISIKNLKYQLEEALKEKDDLNLKLEKFKESSKNLTKLINSQISAKDKVGLGYDSQMNESEVVHSMFNSRESDVDDSLANDNIKKYDSVYKTKVSETETSISKTSKDIIEKPKTIRPSAPIIEDWDTDSDNDSVFRPKSDQTKPKFTKINFVKSDENVKSVNNENTHRQIEYPRKSQNPKDNRRN